MHPVEVLAGYKFRNPLLLAEALTHSSISHETRKRHFDNQRLEFLGDAVLQLLFTNHLYAAFPKSPEGDLTKLRAQLVSRDALAVHAKKLELGTYLLMGKGEEASGGRTRLSTLADAFEAFVGAMYLDHGMPPVEKLVLKLAAKQIRACRARPTEANPKGQLQEILQAISPETPAYEILEEAGPEHDKKFRARVCWCSQDLGRGTGGSKKAAEIAAAKTALRLRRWEKQIPEKPAKTR
jgi:ribonuclease-3